MVKFLISIDSSYDCTIEELRANNYVQIKHQYNHVSLSQITMTH